MDHPTRTEASSDWRASVDAALGAWTEAPPCDHPELPFGPALEPFVAWSRRRLSAALAGPLADRIGDDLRRRLVLIAGPSLEVELVLHRGASLEPGGPDTYAYQALAAGLCGGGWREVLDALPGLGRLIGLTCDQWVGAMTALVGDWRADRDTSPLLADGARDGDASLAAVEVRGPSWRARGRAVRIVDLRSGTRVVYRPHGTALDRAFARLAASLAERAGLPEIVTPPSSDRGDHGWRAWIEHQPCSDHAALTRYYSRAGVLLATSWLLGATDLHAGNVIAAGEHPMLIDLETLLHPDLAGSARPDDVLRTGLIPPPDLCEPDSAGLTAAGEENRPRHAGRPVGAERFVDELTRGLVGALRAARDADLLAPGGALAGLRDMSSCFLLRPGWVYHALLTDSLQPRHLGDEVGRRAALERLHISPSADPTFARLEPLVRAEVEALMRLEHPHFAAPAASTALIVPGGARVPDCLERPAWEALRDRIEDLSDVRIHGQAGLTRASLEAQADRTRGTAP